MCGEGGRRGSRRTLGCCWPCCPGPGCVTVTPDTETALRATAPSPLPSLQPRLLLVRAVWPSACIYCAFSAPGDWRRSGVTVSSGLRWVPADWGPRFQARVRPGAGQWGWGERMAAGSACPGPHSRSRRPVQPCAHGEGCPPHPQPPRLQSLQGMCHIELSKVFS